METIDVLFLPVGKPAEKRTIPHTLEAMQKLVGGLIQLYRLELVGQHTYLDIVMDEEGKLKKRDLNFYIPGDYVVGDVFLMRNNFKSGKWESITDEDVSRFLKNYEPRRVAR